jgi:hypothetical protein
MAINPRLAALIEFVSFEQEVAVVRNAAVRKRLLQDLDEKKAALLLSEEDTTDYNTIKEGILQYWTLK